MKSELKLPFKATRQAMHVFSHSTTSAWIVSFFIPFCFHLFFSFWNIWTFSWKYFFLKWNIWTWFFWTFLFLNFFRWDIWTFFYVLNFFKWNIWTFYFWTFSNEIFELFYFWTFSNEIFELVIFELFSNEIVDLLILKLFFRFFSIWNFVELWTFWALKVKILYGAY